MVEEKTEKEEKLQSLKGKCIVINKDYSGSSNSYYYGGAMYGSEFIKAMIFNFENIPRYIKDNPNEEIIPLDSERGLKLLVDEVHDLENYISIYESRVEDAKEGLKKLYNFDLIQKYVKRFNSINPLIRKDDEETKHNLVERVLEEDA